MLLRILMIKINILAKSPFNILYFVGFLVTSYNYLLKTALFKTEICIFDYKDSYQDGLKEYQTNETTFINYLLLLYFGFLRKHRNDGSNINSIRYNI